MNHTNPFFPRSTCLFKGGASGTPAMPAPPAPPATSTSVEVTQAKIDAKRQAKAKQGVNSTILGGASADAMAPAAGGKNTLLGGG